jgi:hypothetical protein
MKGRQQPWPGRTGKPAGRRVLKRHNHHANRQQANQALAAGDFDSEGLKRWRPLNRWEPRRRPGVTP